MLPAASFAQQSLSSAVPAVLAVTGIVAAAPAALNKSEPLPLLTAAALLPADQEATVSFHKVMAAPASSTR
jgi:hypothetical protein